MKQKDNICLLCTFLTADGMCNRLVHTGGFGINDRVARDYKKGNSCEYFKEGSSSHNIKMGHTCNSSLS